MIVMSSTQDDEGGANSGWGTEAIDPNPNAAGFGVTVPIGRGLAGWTAVRATLNAKFGLPLYPTSISNFDNPVEDAVPVAHVKEVATGIVLVAIDGTEG